MLKETLKCFQIINKTYSLPNNSEYGEFGADLALPQSAERVSDSK